MLDANTVYSAEQAPVARVVIGPPLRPLVGLAIRAAADLYVSAGIRIAYAHRAAGQAEKRRQAEREPDFFNAAKLLTAMTFAATFHTPSL